MPCSTVLFELSGEHPTLPRAEVLACLGAESSGFREVEAGPGFLVAECDQGSVSTIAERLALTHRLGRYLGNVPLDDIEKAVPGIQLPEGTLCVRIKTVKGLHPEVDTYGLAKKVGHLLSGDHRIDLSSPDIRLRILLSERAHFFIEDREIDRKQFDKRKVAERPFFSPISLHPRYARALVNLTGTRRGDVLLDPFCGTGGIVLEAALLGLKVVGSDIDREMVEGCQRNLEHFGVHGVRVEVSDVGDIESNFAPVDAVATDPPYGRAASTKKEDIDRLYFRGLRAMTGTVVHGGRIGVVLPRPIEATGLELVQMHEQRVHRSLTRHYHLFIRP